MIKCVLYVKLTLTHGTFDSSNFLWLLSLSVSQVECQLGDLVCDCSVIYFLDKCGTMRVAVAASVITSVTAVSIGGCVVCWPWTFTLDSFVFLMGDGVLRMLSRITFFLERCWTVKSLQTAGSTITDCKNDTQFERHTHTHKLHTYSLLTRVHADANTYTHTHTHMLWQIQTKAWEMFSLPCRVIICHPPQFSHSGNINRQKNL